ncbi:MAG: cytochrome c-type biogenesis protein [Geminicoccaceae bacterium]
MRKLVLLLCLLAGPVLAATSPSEMLQDPALEARARELGQELRCLVCQNQSIDDSDADLAADIRQLVRERLVAGDTDQQVRDYMVARYGDFVLLKPPVRASTWLLWAGPFIVLLIGAALIATHLRRRAVAPAPTDLSAEERRRLDALVGGPERAPEA